MAGVTVTVQVVDVSIFSPEKAKKNIKGRVTLSDGSSKVICMLPESTFNSMVSIGRRAQGRQKPVVPHESMLLLIGKLTNLSPFCISRLKKANRSGSSTSGS